MKKNQDKIISARERNLLFLYFASKGYAHESRREKLIKRLARFFGKKTIN